VDIDIKPVTVDKMATWEARALESRLSRIEELLQEHRERAVSLQEALTDTQTLVSFLEKEHANTQLAQQLSENIVVRVVCPDCKGTGMRPANVTTGVVSQGSAFESVGKPVTTQTPVIDERNRCPGCKGQRWVIMERFKG
jgi:hypothetical protein